MEHCFQNCSKIKLTQNVASEPKKPKVEKKYQLIEVQQKLLHVCRFKDFKTLRTLFLSKVNQFVIKYVDKKTIFLQKSNAFPCPSQCKVHL
jgi:hypothetical protein